MRRRLLVTAAVWILGAALLRVTLAQPEHCPAVDADLAHEAAISAAGWIERAQEPDGRYVYEFHEDTGRGSGAYNAVRHAGVTMSLYQLAAEGDRSFLDVADRGMAYMRRNLARGDDWAAFAPSGTNPRLGSTALMLAGLALRRNATGDAEHDRLIHSLSQFLLTMQRGDGQFYEEYDLDDDAPVPTYSRYFTGESFWALSLVAHIFPDEGWDAEARKTAHFLATERDDEDDFPFPPWPDQWAAYGLAEVSAGPNTIGLARTEADYARRLAGRFGLLLRTESKRRDGGLTELVLYRPARASGMGTWIEGATSLWRTTHNVDGLADVRDDLAERIECGAGMLVDRQRRSGDDLVRGAWFDEGVTRMDDQQHALSALLYASQVLSEESP